MCTKYNCRAKMTTASETACTACPTPALVHRIDLQPNALNFSHKIAFFHSQCVLNKIIFNLPFGKMGGK